MKKDKINSKVDLKFNLVKFYRLCLRNWLLFVACMAVCLVLACGFLYVRTPKSEVMASLKLPPESVQAGFRSITDLASSFNIGDMFGSSSTDNEVAMLSSHAVYMKTVKDLGLNEACFEKLGPLKWSPVYGDKVPFSVTPTNNEVNDTISRALLFKIGVNGDETFDINVKIKRNSIFSKKGVSLPYTVATNYGTFVVDKTATFGTRNPGVKTYRITFSSYNGAAQGLARKVRAYAPDKKTDFIALSYITNDPKFGELLLNTIIDNYNLVCTEERNDQETNTLGFVDKRLASLEEELTQIEERMETFKKANNLTEVEVDAATLLATSSELEKSQLMASIECEALKMAKEFVSNQENKYSLIPSLGEDKSSAATSITDYNQMIIQRMRLLDASTPNNTALNRLDAQIDAMRESVIESIDRSYEQAKMKLETLDSKSASTASRLSTLPALEREYIGIERDLVLKQQLYLFLLKQREESTMSLSQIQPSLITVDAPYTLSEPVGVTKKMAFAFAVLMGLIIPLLLTYYLKYKKAPLTVKDVYTVAQQPILGKVANDSSNDCLPVLDRSSGESIRQLRAEVVRIIEGLDSDKKSAVMVASAFDGEGKTYLATNLAVSLALLGKSVLLVEADLSKGNQSLMGYDLKSGLANLVSNDAASCVYDVDLKCEGSRLSLLGPGAVGHRNPDDIVGHEKVKASLVKLMRDYQYTVIDTASFVDHSGAFELADLVDLTICPVTAGHSTLDSITKVDAVCQEGRMPRMAIVVNMA